MHYRQLKRYGPNMFENDGSLLVNIDGVEKRKDGREHILKTLAYFEVRDEPVHYRICMVLKRVLDVYDQRFKTGPPDKMSEFRSIERERLALTRKFE